MNLQWYEFANTDELDLQLAQQIAQQLQAAITERGSASLAVSGGRTPAGMFKVLRSSAIDWSKVIITLVDERWVSNDHADSNERLTRENLLQDCAAAATFISMVNDAATPHAGLEGIEAQFSTIKAPIDIIILGMGDDGHTASLFRNAIELEAVCASTAWVAAVTPPAAPHQRITLTLPTIAQCRNLLVHITGEGKKALLNNAMAEQKPVTEQYPIRRVIDQAASQPQVYWAA